MQGEPRRLPYSEPDYRPTMLARVLNTVSLVNPVFFFFFPDKKAKGSKRFNSLPLIRQLEGL